MTVLVDSSVWMAHLRSADRELTALLEAGEVACHQFIIGEIACGHLARRAEILRLLGRLPSVPIVSHGEALAFAEGQRLAGSGLGWVDVHLLAAARVAPVRFWTADKALRRAAARIGLAY